jgi:XRE family aerobic/anaerobic benzoate catabolism transcriptional regulator
MDHETLLATIGARVRALRERQGLTRRQLSRKSGLSERFLGQLEVGRGNISLSRFADVADALGTSPAELMTGRLSRQRSTSVVALLGVRGAGKSTIGARVATGFGVPFIEVDQRIEQLAGLDLARIFEVHGDAYYHRLERKALEELLAEPHPAVIATGGSVVGDSDNYAMLCEGACTVWLRATAEDHWNRVVRQGDARPMAGHPDAFAELRTLLNARGPLYSSARYVVDTSGRSIEQVAELVRSAVAEELAVAGP